MPTGYRPAAPRSVIVMAVGATIAIAGSIMPWVSTGSRSRHSYDVFELVERLGFSPDGVGATALRWWPTMPFAVIAAVVATWWAAGWLGIVLGLLAGCYAGGVGSAVAAAAPGPGVDIRFGAIVTAVGGWLLVAGAGVELVLIVRDGRISRRTRATSDPPAPSHRTGGPTRR
jgi:hypothetical protein